MDIIIVLVIIGILVFLFKRTFSSFVYAVALSDIFLRIVTFLKVQLFKGDICKFFDKYFPESIPGVIDKYLKDIDILNIILLWTYVILMCIFEVYIIKTFIRKK